MHRPCRPFDSEFTRGPRECLAQGRPSATARPGTKVALRQPLLSDVVSMSVPRAWVLRASVGSWAVPASLMLVAAVSPFERPIPGSLLGFTFTTLELSVAAALAAGVFAVARDPSAPGWRTPITIPLAALLACALVSSLAAPDFRSEERRVGKECRSR